jgi:putative Ca2+/H+ antiporter (TMEM165/GDT1 family)
LVIVVIEVGDRTFFIAALMGIKHNQVLVFIGAFSALAFMTVVSTVMGVAAPLLLPRWFTHYAAFVLFSFFGCQLLHKAYGMQHGVSEELEEVRRTPTLTHSIIKEFQV